MITLTNIQPLRRNKPVIKNPKGFEIWSGKIDFIKSQLQVGKNPQYLAQQHGITYRYLSSVLKAYGTSIAELKGGS